MSRLLAGRAQRTNGALTKNNLYAEADVSRATMNRHKGIMTEWDELVACRREPGRASEEEASAKDVEIKRLRAEVRDLNGQLAAAATVIAALYGEKLELKRAKQRKKKQKAKTHESSEA